jgi:hypothetical protein
MLGIPSINGLPKVGLTAKVAKIAMVSIFSLLGHQEEDSALATTF